MILSAREKLLIALLAVFLVSTGVFYGVRDMLAYEQGITRQIRVRETALQKVATLKGEIASMQRPKRRAVRTRSLIGYVEQLAATIHLKDRIQLNLIPQDPNSGFQRIDVKVDNLTLDEMLNLVYTFENADLTLIIGQVEISPAFRDKELLRLSMRVVARE